MKSTVKKISLLLIVSVTLLLSSCLDSGPNSYIGYDEYSYITRSETGIVFARTASGNLITSEKISSLQPGSAVLLSFEVSGDDEVIKIDEVVNIYKVNLGREPIILKQEPLRLSSAPEVEPVYIENIFEPQTWVTMKSLYFGDRWPFTFQYNAKKGEEVKFSFYKVPEDELPTNLNADVLIDIRMVKSGTPEPNANDELKNENIVGNMTLLREISASADSQEVKELTVKFRYYKADKEGELYITTRPIGITVQI